jgi:hypothetical protein
MTVYSELNGSNLSLNWICSCSLCEWFWFVASDPKYLNLAMFCVFISHVYTVWFFSAFEWRRHAYVLSLCLLLDQPDCQRLIEFLLMNVISLQIKKIIGILGSIQFAPRYFKLVTSFMFLWAVFVVCFCCAFWCRDVYIYVLCINF